VVPPVDSQLPRICLTFTLASVPNDESFVLGSSGPAYRRVAEIIRSQILDGTLATGDQLPIESELATRLKVSRSTVREALRSLSSENLVVTTRGAAGGTFVKHPDPNEISDSLETGLSVLALSSDIALEELFEARETLEIPAARMAAERRTPDALNKLRASLPSKREVDRAHLFEGNKAFHESVLDASGNRLLAVMTLPIYSVLRDHFLRDAAPPSFWEKVEKEHRAILRAIEVSDPIAAGEEMAAHLTGLSTLYTTIDSEASTRPGPPQGRSRE